MWTIGILFFLAWLAPDQALAHAIGEVYALPVPLVYYLWSSAAAVALSFLVVSFFLKQKHYERPIKTYRIPWLGLILRLARWISVGIFLLLVVSGLFGNQDPTSNITPLFFWISFVFGWLILSALVGNMWQWLNPWKTIALWSHPTIHPPQRSITPWLAPGLLLGLYWLELISPHPYQPQLIAAILLGYTVLNLLGYRLFKHWFIDGELFSVLFSYIGTLSSLRLNEKSPQVKIVPYLMRLTERKVTGGLMLLAFVLLAGTSFDSLKETLLWYQWLDRFGIQSAAHYSLAQVVTLILLPAPGFLAYSLAIWSMARLTRTQDWFSLARDFIWSLAPIAFGYILAHNVSLLVSTLPLLSGLISDPFGLGWNLFGTVHLAETSLVLGAKPLWFIELGCVIAAHIGGVWTAHLIALKRFPDSRTAIVSQIPILCLMLLYTVATLWLLSQPLVVSPR